MLPEFYEKEAAAGRKAYADVIVVDPPRKGCDEKLLDTIVKMAPDRVVYVSCDSATLARVLKIRVSKGMTETCTSGGISFAITGA